MPNFDFHNALSSTEFENLCRDIIEIRETPLKFRTFKEGRDGGIDIECTNSETKIIGQAKRYAPQHYSKFFASLKSEVKKCQEIKPIRYILFTSLDLINSNLDDIITLFEGYIINKYDIIDRNKLNQYLDGLEYEHLKKTYSTLLIPNFNYVELLLNNILTKNINQDTKEFISEIKKEKELFYNINILEECIDKLEKNNILIISGNPGIGKTTIAKMIAEHFISQEIDDITFIPYKPSLNPISELSKVNFQEHKQLFIIDDFWGSNFSSNYKNRDELKSFLRLLNQFNKDSGNYLIITSRSYIIKDIFTKAESEIKDSINFNNYTVDIEEYTIEDRAKIFLNHLLFYDLDRNYISHLEYSKELDNIVNHRNYSPRHIEYFIKQHIKSENANSYDFYKEFLKYLDNPSQYWKENFELINKTSLTILITLLISNDPLYLNDLKSSFIKIEKLARNELNFNTNPSEFFNEIKTLEEFFLVSNKEQYNNDVSIKFQSPGIKDYLLEYLRENIEFWGEVLISGAIFFNQLNFVFDTKIRKIQNDYNDISLYGNKIVLPFELQKNLKERILRDFNILNFSTIEDDYYLSDFHRNSNSNQTKYWKLYLFSELFNIVNDENIDVRNFIVQETLNDINSFEINNGKIVNEESMLEFPRVIQLIKPYLNINPLIIISAYYESITFTKEYSAFYEFKELFPKEFEEYISGKMRNIRKLIKEQIIDDIDYYQYYELDVNLDTLLDYEIENVCKLYEIKLTKKFVNEIEDMAGRKLYLLNSNEKEIEISNELKNDSEFLHEDKNTDLEKIVREYLYDENQELEKPKKFIKEYCKDKNLTISLINQFKKGNSIVNCFATNKLSLSLLIDFFEKTKVGLDNSNKHELLSKFCDYHSQKENFKFDELLENIAFESLSNDGYFSLKKINTDLKNINLLDCNSECLYPLLVVNKNWYKFINDEIKEYFLSKYLNKIESDDEYYEIVSEIISELTDILKKQNV